jgi:hypothetical protein
VLQGKLEAGKTEVSCDHLPYHDVKIQRLISDVFLSEREQEAFERRRGIQAENYYEQHFYEVEKVVQGDEVGRDKVGGDKFDATIGENAQNVAVGKGNEQTIMQGTTMRPSTKSTKPVNNAWINGLFYLIALATIPALIAYISHQVAWYVLPIVLSSGLLAVGVIGALQLRKDDQLSKLNFLGLMVETYQRLPWLKRNTK